MSWFDKKAILENLLASYIKKRKWAGPDYIICEDCACIAEGIYEAYQKDDLNTFTILGEQFSRKRCRTPGCGEPLPRKLRGKWPPPVVIPSSR